ncbi:phosphoadenosine phosphosulfate reductase family protein [Rhizobium cauense]|uniref:phosphoadenosine phosphosulfate reductase domain-containing protein n=1 Tax=Rhizobium cauense TaxID=1166683 RepID=UPI001C6EE34F|nr:phosphoadenosine phosphosulfate reductase family protein [Rhizobium cauense]MBW9113137.1 phosphoadenosine phosphosulfate reductase family protein [Rhizobium cauense]
MFAVATLPFLDLAIADGSPVAIGVSGGKDSQAAALAAFRYLDQCGHVGPRILVHADLGVVEWRDSLRICEELAAHLGCELLVVRRKAGDLMDRWEARWRSSIDRYAALETVTLVPCWSTPRMRFCTSELKTHVIQAELRRRYKGQTVINATGVRREESAARSKATVADQGTVNDNFINWRPIVDWTVQEVFSAIDTSGLAPHPAYRDGGMSRVSCMFCIMSNIADLTAAAAQPESHELYRRMVELECESSFAFQGSRWLGDVAPQLLTGNLRDRLLVAKSTALWRTQAEARITDGMLYVKGWPTRMLTDAEADILASVRSEIGALFGIECACLDRESIHERYAELMRHREAA